jgi:uncharacterized protein with PQ loop repeat
MTGLPDAAVDLIGSLAGLLTTAAFVPLVIKTRRSKSAEDLSSPHWWPSRPASSCG